MTDYRIEYADRLLKQYDSVITDISEKICSSSQEEARAITLEFLKARKAEWERYRKDILNE